MHSIFGQDDTDSFTLNFIGPLFIECGFPRTTADILMKGEKLDPNEVAYIIYSKASTNLAH